jgi:NADH-quinone oxidoreductase chain G
MMTITVNERKIELEKPSTILEAARRNGIDIPTFCEHPVLELWGGCRMCLVEIEKMPRLQTSCTVQAADGMVVYTETPKVVEARKATLEFLLINHPLECPICDKAGECDLQDLTVQYGAAAGRFKEGKRRHPESVDDPIIVRNMERCIVCTRCIRMCDGVQGASAIEVTGRGNRSFVEPFSGGRYNCEYCGNCLTTCPVGAIMSKLHRYSYRPWQMDRVVKTICPYCGVGCTLPLQVRDEAIRNVSPEFGAGVNNGLLCSRGRFGYEYVSSPERLRTPLIRKNGALRQASWPEALDFTARRLKEIRDANGGSSIGAIASARCTNEENYLLQKIMRAGLGSNNIDSIARMGLLPAQRILEGLLGQGIAANLISGIPHSDAVLVAGGDPTVLNPVMGLQVRAAARAGKTVITVGHAAGLKRHRTHALMPHPGGEGIVLAGLLSELLNLKPLPGEEPTLEEIITGWELPGPDFVEKQTGVPASDIVSLAAELKSAETSSIIVGRLLMAHPAGKRNMHIVAALVYLLNGRVILISERPNEQGLAEMGCAPDILPGERPLSIESFRKRYEDAWRSKLPAEDGLTLMEMFEAAARGSLKALYVLGENPAFNLPGGKLIIEALGKLELLAVQDVFMTETAKMADVVLPALGWAEKEGTFTNLEKRIQVLRKALNAEGMEDWRILAEVGRRLGLEMDYPEAGHVMAEIARLSPLHAGLSYNEIGDGLLWPYRGEPLRAKAKGTAMIGMDSFDSPESSNGLAVVIDRPLFHSGTTSRQSPALLGIMGEPAARMSPGTASSLGLSEGSPARISTDKGSLTLNVRTDEDLPENALFLGNNFMGAGAMALMGYEFEPETKTPAPTVSNLKVERI